MKKECIKYISAALFVCLFLFKGIAAVAPLLFWHHQPDASSVIAMNNETEESNKNVEDKAEKEFKEVYVFEHYTFHTITTDVLATAKNIEANKIIYKQAVYISIPTPPPEFA